MGRLKLKIFIFDLDIFFLNLSNQNQCFHRFNYEVFSRFNIYNMHDVSLRGDKPYQKSQVMLSNIDSFKRINSAVNSTINVFGQLHYGKYLQTRDLELSRCADLTEIFVIKN